MLLWFHAWSFCQTLSACGEMTPLTPTMRCSEPGLSVAVAIIAARVSGR